MRVELLEDRERKTFAVAFSKNQEPVSGLRWLAKERMLAGSVFTGIGAFLRAARGYFDRERRDYERIPIDDI